MQIAWVQSVQKLRMQEFKSAVQRSVAVVTSARIAADQLTAEKMEARLMQAFSSSNMEVFPFEYRVGIGGKYFSSRDFKKVSLTNAAHLSLYYVLPDGVLTVVVPNWKRYAVKDMGWIIGISILLTLMIAVVFYYAVIFSERAQRSFDDSRSAIIKNVVGNLQTPLSTVSVAVEALQDAKVMHDAKKMGFYRQVINQESKKMNEQVEKFLRGLK